VAIVEAGGDGQGSEVGLRDSAQQQPASLPKTGGTGDAWNVAPSDAIKGRANLVLGLGVLSFCLTFFAGIPALLLGYATLKKKPDSGQGFKIWLGMGCAALGSMAGLVAVVSGEIEEREAARVTAELRAEEEAQREIAKAELASQVADVAVELEGVQKRADTALESKAVKESKASIGQWRKRLREYEKHDLGEVQELAVARENIVPREQHLKALVLFSRGNELVAEKRYIAAEGKYTKVEEMLESCEHGDYCKRLESLGKEAAKKRRSIQSRVKQEQKKKAEAEALALVCGDKPTVDPWDGGMIAVDRYFKNTANDPSSIDSENCTTPVLTDNCWRVTCVVRGKNAFGALIANQYTLYVGRNSQMPSMHSVIGVK